MMTFAMSMTFNLHERMELLFSSTIVLLIIFVENSAGGDESSF
jgi:hypothetical protein